MPCLLSGSKLAKCDADLEIAAAEAVCRFKEANEIGLFAIDNRDNMDIFENIYASSAHNYNEAYKAHLEAALAFKAAAESASEASGALNADFGYSFYQIIIVILIIILVI